MAVGPVLGLDIVFGFDVWQEDSAPKVSATMKQEPHASCFWCGSASTSNLAVSDPPLCRSCQIQLNRLPKDALVRIAAYLAGYNSVAFRLLGEGHRAIQELTEITRISPKPAIAAGDSSRRKRRRSPRVA
jgi:hypothetical protein